jgi:CheY-like chemotaxis protein
MKKYLILCVDDEREVLDSVLSDLSPLTELFELDGAQSVIEARQVISEYQAEGGELALILADHIMPGELGIDFLIQLNHDPVTEHCKKVLLTGQAALNDTIDAINRGGLNYYLPKPWSRDQLYQTAVEKLTDFILEQPENPLPYARLLDGVRIFAHAQQHRVEI